MDLFNVLGRLIGERVRFIWNFLPLAVECLGEEIGGLFIKTITVFHQWSPEARRLATKWRRKAMESRLITLEYGTQVWWAFYLLAYVSYVTGWLLPPLLVVWIVSRIV